MSVILNATDPYHLVYAGQGAGVIANRDTIDTVLLGPSEGSLFRSNPEVSILDPLTSVPIDGVQDIWAIVDGSVTNIAGDDLLAEVDVIQTATGWAPSPASIATALIASGFATTLAIAMAQAIAQGGISLISEPVPLYISQTNPPPSGAGYVGASVFSGTFPDQNTRLGASNEFDGFLHQKWARSTQKFYMEEGIWSGSRLTEMINMQPNLQHMVLSLKPGRSSNGDYSNTSKVSMAPSGATLAQEHASLVSFLATLNANGMTPAFCDIILWNEANDKGTNGAFTDLSFYPAYVAFYQDAVRAAGYKLCYNPLLANGQIAAMYPGDANCDKVLVDYYAWDYFKVKNGQQVQATLTSAYGDNPMALADNHLPSPIPFGVVETGLSDGTSAPSIPDFINWWNTQIINPMVTRLQSGKVNGDGPVWFDGGKGGNVITTATPATQIAAMQAGYNKLSKNIVGSGASSGITLPATSTTLLTPANPSPGAGYAIADQMSYSINLILQAQATGSTNPFVVLRITWYEQDDPNATAVDVQYWHCPIGGSAGGSLNIRGHGPQIAQFCKVQLQNLDTIACTANFGMTGESRTAQKHDIRWDAPPANPVANAGNLGFNGPGGAFNALCMGSVSNAALGAGATSKFITGMRAGNTWMHWVSDSTKVTLTVSPVPSSSWGSVELWSPVTATDDAIVGFPRAPAQLVITNTDTVAHSYKLEIISIED
jgi:hypothetical protein